MSDLDVALVSTPIGSFRIGYQGRTVRVVDLMERGHETTALPEGPVNLVKPPYPKGSPPAQLRDYFRGSIQHFDLDVEPTMGHEFDRAVWKVLREVPPGKTITYGELARRAGHAGAARAAGGAMHRNPIPIIVPCHRAVGADGSLTGFGLNLWRKRWLLQHEGAWPIRSRTVDGPMDPAQRTLDGGRGARAKRARAVRKH
ncbi:MAG: methylated-DNA--[protein]-cysteine S-methyltransferase [Thermoplasmata archaeon]|nr:methylated-DNA--[protein]-cysteine S-methyltransferase [Thermoplasmata archaeon]